MNCTRRDFLRSVAAAGAAAGGLSALAQAVGDSGATTFSQDAATAPAASPVSTPAPGPRRPNLLLIVTDDHRPDGAAALGNPTLRTPVLDRLVSEGAAFSRCYVTVPVCTPSRAELYSGVSPFHNGVRWFGEPLRPELPLLSHTLARAGYRTCFTGKWHNDADPAAHGWTETRRVYIPSTPLPTRDWIRFEEDGKPVEGYTSELFADAAIEFIKQGQADAARPWFITLATMAPHDPLTPPPEIRQMYPPEQLPLPDNYMPLHPFDNGEMTIRDELLTPFPRTPKAIREQLADYYATITHLDGQIGRVLEALEATGQAEHTIVAWVGDNGLAKGSHGLMGKMSMYDHSARVPLVLRGPGVPAGVRSAACCVMHDVYPTLCELAGVPITGEVEGMSLAPVLRAERATMRETICCAYRDVQRMACDARWKYIEYPKTGMRQLFDRDADPGELINLLDDYWYRPTLPYYEPEKNKEDALAQAERLRSALRAWQASVGDPLRPDMSPSSDR